MLPQDPQDDLVMLLGIFRPVHDSPVGDRVFLELLQKRVQMAVGVKLDLRGQLSQPLPLGKRMAHLIPLYVPSKAYDRAKPHSPYSLGNGPLL